MLFIMLCVFVFYPPNCLSSRGCCFSVGHPFAILLREPCMQHIKQFSHQLGPDSQRFLSKNSYLSTTFVVIFGGPGGAK